MICGLNPQADSLLFAAALLLLQPIQIEEADPVFQIGGLNSKLAIHEQIKRVDSLTHTDSQIC